MTSPENTTNGIVIGGIYDHVSGSTSYRVDEVLTRAEGYETGEPLTQDVIYTQLNDGEINPAGTRYTRSLGQFTLGTVEVNGEQRPIFTLRA
jgi:hypothetical protein